MQTPTFMCTSLCMKWINKQIIMLENLFSPFVNIHTGWRVLTSNEFLFKKPSQVIFKCRKGQITWRVFGPHKLPNDSLFWSNHFSSFGQLEWCFMKYWMGNSKLNWKLRCSGLRSLSSWCKSERLQISRQSTAIIILL